MTDWLTPYESAIEALQRLEWDFLGSDQDEIAERTREMADILTPIVDGDAQPGDFENARAAWWHRFGAEDLERARREVELQLQLKPLYRRLAQAPQEDWDDYAQLLLKLRFNPESPLLRMLLPSTHVTSAASESDDANHTPRTDAVA